MRFVLPALLACASLAQGAATDRHVVVISIDGLPGYLIDDSKAALPHIRELMAKGAVAEGGMRVANPSVTWPNHTTLMTGLRPDAHGVLFNGVIEREGPSLPLRIVAAKTQRELVRVPLLFDILKGAGLTSAAINWPCTRESGSIDDNMPDVPSSLDYTTPRLKAELSEAKLLDDFDGGSAVVRDLVWTEAACRIIRDRQPNLLVLHLLNVDGTHHKYGPQTPPGYSAAALADERIGQVARTIAAAPNAANTTLIIVSDHGFITTTKSLRPNVILRDAGWIEADAKGRVTRARAFVVAEGGTGMLYFTDPALKPEDRESIRWLFDGVEGISSVVAPDQYATYGYPATADHAGMADLVIACREGYSVGGSAAGDKAIVDQDGSLGAHGFLSTEPKMNAVFVAAGPGIEKGTRLGTIDNVDLAPTVARILGVDLPATSGHVLEPVVGHGN